MDADMKGRLDAIETFLRVSFPDTLGRMGLDAWFREWERKQAHDERLNEAIFLLHRTGYVVAYREQITHEDAAAALASIPGLKAI
jgi:hypothetical protein